MAIRKIDSLSGEQIKQLHALYQNEWWTDERSLDDVRHMLEHTDLVFGFVDEPTGRLVVFCRLLTDFAYHATLYDVIVAESHRGEGLGREMMDVVLAEPRLRRVPCIWLCCLPEMMSFYEKWGFETTESEMQWMRALKTNPAMKSTPVAS